jgi:hypothetical protein
MPSGQYAYDPYADEYAAQLDPNYVPPAPQQAVPMTDASSSNNGTYTAAPPSQQPTVDPGLYTPDQAMQAAGGQPVAPAPASEYQPVAGGVVYDNSGPADTSYQTPANGYPINQGVPPAPGAGYSPPVNSDSLHADPAQSYLYESAVNQFQQQQQPKPQGELKPQDTYLGGINPAIPRAHAWNPIVPEQRNNAGIDGLQHQPALQERHNTRGTDAFGQTGTDGTSDPHYVPPPPQGGGNPNTISGSAMYGAGGKHAYETPYSTGVATATPYLEDGTLTPTTNDPLVQLANGSTLRSSIGFGRSAPSRDGRRNTSGSGTLRIPEPTADFAVPVAQDLAHQAFGNVTHPATALPVNQHVGLDRDLPVPGPLSNPDHLGGLLHAVMGNPADAVILPLMQQAAISAMGDNRVPREDESGKFSLRASENQTSWKDTGSPDAADALGNIFGHSWDMQTPENFSPSNLPYWHDSSTPEDIADAIAGFRNAGNWIADPSGSQNVDPNNWWDKSAYPWLATAAAGIAKTENNPGYDPLNPLATGSLVGQAVAPTVSDAAGASKKSAEAAVNKAATDFSATPQGQQVSAFKDRAASAIQQSHDASQRMVDQAANLKSNVDAGVKKAQGILAGKALAAKASGRIPDMPRLDIPPELVDFMNTPLPHIGDHVPSMDESLTGRLLQSGQQVGSILAGKNTAPPGKGVAAQEPTPNVAPDVLATGQSLLDQARHGWGWPDTRLQQKQAKNALLQADQAIEGADAATQNWLLRHGIDQTKVQDAAAPVIQAAGDQAAAQGWGLVDRVIGGVKTKTDPAVYGPGRATYQPGAKITGQGVESPSSSTPTMGTPDVGQRFGGTREADLQNRIVATQSAWQADGRVDGQGNLSGQMLARAQAPENRHVDANGNWTAKALADGIIVYSEAVGKKANLRDMAALHGMDGADAPTTREATDADLAGSGVVATDTGSGSNDSKPYVPYSKNSNSGYTSHSYGGGGGRSYGGGGGGSYGHPQPNIDEARSVLGPDFMKGFMDDFAFKDMFGADFPFGEHGSPAGGHTSSRKTGRKTKRSKYGKTRRGTPPNTSARKKPTTVGFPGSKKP